MTTSFSIKGNEVHGNVVDNNMQTMASHALARLQSKFQDKGVTSVKAKIIPETKPPSIKFEVTHTKDIPGDKLKAALRI